MFEIKMEFCPKLVSRTKNYESKLVQKMGFTLKVKSRPKVDYIPKVDASPKVESSR